MTFGLRWDIFCRVIDNHGDMGVSRRLARQLHWFRIEHVRREQNAGADRLANEAMDRGK